MKAVPQTEIDPRDHAAEIRRRKRAESELIGLDEEAIGRVVESFYGRLRKDAMLGPIFGGKISDWPEHLGRMKQFWRSVLFSSGEYSGNPMVKHQAMPNLTEAHFIRWLELFYQTLREECRDPEAIALMGGRARMIAESLLLGISMRRDGLAAASKGRNLPHVR